MNEIKMNKHLNLLVNYFIFVLCCDEHKYFLLVKEMGCSHTRSSLNDISRYMYRYRYKDTRLTFKEIQKNDQVNQ